MPRWLAVRTLSVIPTLFGVAVLVFLLIRFIPGTVVDQILGAQFGRTEGQVAALREYFGLDQPLLVQFWNWFRRMLTGPFRPRLDRSRGRGRCRVPRTA